MSYIGAQLLCAQTYDLFYLSSGPLRSNLFSHGGDVGDDVYSFADGVITVANPVSRQHVPRSMGFQTASVCHVTLFFLKAA